MKCETVQLDRHRRFGGTCLHPIHWHLSTRRHISQNRVFKITALRTQIGPPFSEGGLLSLELLIKFWFWVKKT